MKIPRLLVFHFSALLLASSALALTKEELEARAKDMPTVKEKDLPPMKNEREPFLGKVHHAGLAGYTWVKFPFVENPASFGFDRKGRLFVAEANRFWLGVPDLRGANQLIRGDFQSKTVDDRQKLYDLHAATFPDTFFTNTADRIIRLEDRDGNGAADHRTLFSDHFNQPLDGLGFSVLAEDDAVYFTCIPKVWKMTDTDDDGVADSHEAIAEGFGVRVSFIGHDLHGITRGPDGRLYFSIGDRGYHVTTADGKVHAASGRGAIFRCESDGTGFEVFCKGLRNPQELAFDEYGNLFTFDNTGDIGDLARMVYALEGSDSGWDMSHQSAHHYVTHLDWQSFHPEKSMWVAERMFDTFNEEQPQWVYPPASHVARGPSGVTWLTGESIPQDLRGKFLLANYRGPSENCTVLTVGIEKKGAGYHAISEDVLIEGTGVSDVALGYDGNIYLCDFGGGWSVNTNGGIQAISSTDATQQAVGAELKKTFAAGFKDASIATLVSHLSSPDKRLRQFAQFELVERGEVGQNALAEVAANAELPATTRLHGIWGLGQIGRRGGEVTDLLLSLATDAEPEVRANVGRTLGSYRATGAREALLAMLTDDTTRVQSLAAIALGRSAENGDSEVIDALYGIAERNGAGEIDPVLRHAVVSALESIGTVDSAAARADATSSEVRLTALLVLRRYESEAMVTFLTDADPLIVREAVRGIYDTSAVDGPAGVALATMVTEAATWPETIQRRVVAANFRQGESVNAKQLVAMASDQSLADSVREAALLGLSLWDAAIVTDPVLGHYRPLTNPERSVGELGESIGDGLTQFLSEDQAPALVALALNLAVESGVALDEKTLRGQILNDQLAAEIRVAALDSLVANAGESASALVSDLMTSDVSPIAAAAIRHGFSLKVDGVGDAARQAILSRSNAEARAAIDGLAKSDPEMIVRFWNARESDIRRDLWLDLFLALKDSEASAAQEAVTAFTSAGPNVVYPLSEAGGDSAKGELVFQNQGACLQCHKVGNQGGIQGPDLTKIGNRMKPDKLVEALWNPGAEIAEGYGSSAVTLKDGTVLAGRITKDDEVGLHLVGIDGTPSVLARGDIESVTPPISAMPPLGMSLLPRDLRDLVAYLVARTGKNGGEKSDAASHGKDEKIAK